MLAYYKETILYTELFLKWKCRERFYHINTV